jgi:hypothetical protein
MNVDPRFGRRSTLNVDPRSAVVRPSIEELKRLVPVK